MKKIMDTHIAGDFQGWNNEHIYELENGTSWSLSTPTCSQTYKYRPRAIIWRNNIQYFLEIEDMNPPQEVFEIW